MLVDFSYYPQIHDWGWIYFYLKEENAWDIILDFTKVDFFLDFFFLKYCIQINVYLIAKKKLHYYPSSIMTHKNLSTTPFITCNTCYSFSCLALSPLACLIKFTVIYLLRMAHCIHQGVTG